MLFPSEMLITPKYLIEVIRFISLSFINNDGSFKEILSFSQALGIMYI